MRDDMGTLHAAGDRMTLRFERRLAHPPESVWRMITRPEGLARWFPARTELESFEVGAEMTFTFDEADVERAKEAGVEDVPVVSNGFVRAIDPLRVFEFDWLGEVIRFELEPDGEGCRLVFTHEFERDVAQAPKNGAGWHLCLEALEAALDSVEGPGDERGAALQERYARELVERR